MLKINLHTLQEQDLEMFAYLHFNVNINIHNTIDDILIGGSRDIACLTTNDTLLHNKKIVEYLLASPNNRFIITDIYEGYREIFDNLSNFFESRQVMLICSSQGPNGYVVVNVDEFLPMVAQNKVNQIISYNIFDKIYENKNKLYSFLFLNKVPRSHRTKLIDKLKHQQLLESALWSDHSTGKELPNTVVDYYSEEQKENAVQLLGHTPTWPDGIIFPDLYTNTYFSVITETFFDNPNVFFTEKTYKVLMIGHPFILVSSAGAYKKLHERGYQTFSNFIDESFDEIENNDLRLEMISNSIAELVSSDLNNFLEQAKHICEHNRMNFLREYGQHSITTYNQMLTWLTDNFSI